MKKITAGIILGLLVPAIACSIASEESLSSTPPVNSGQTPSSSLKDSTNTAVPNIRKATIKAIADYENNYSEGYKFAERMMEILGEKLKNAKSPKESLEHIFGFATTPNIPSDVGQRFATWIILDRIDKVSHKQYVRIYKKYFLNSELKPKYTVEDFERWKAILTSEYLAVRISN